ncbi:MAG TPA: hypothetical protein VFR97_04090 [Capillimicrobium sp.]|nr:hypothetical protein [Capillimicrobium sp.]
MEGDRLTVGEPEPEPVLGPGALGAFDDSGVTGSCIVDHGGRKHLYYSGWSRGVTVPFYFYAGLAVSLDGGRTFERVSEAPVMERSAVDPYLTASPWVLVEEGRWRAWYVSCTGWFEGPGGPVHRYHVRYAESVDGVTWQRDGTVALDFAGPHEYAFGRPCVRPLPGGGYEMRFSVRGDAYRLGVARSDDGLRWRRVEEEPPAPGDWDAEMATYPVVFDHEDATFMLYNGNGYGASGTGYAIDRHGA